MKTTISIKGLVFHCVVGVTEAERQEKQPVIVDLRLTYNAEKAVATDSIGDALDYQKVIEQVDDLVSASSFRLLESLSESIGRSLIKGFPALDTVSVKLNKPEIKGLLAQELDKVEVKLTLKREDVS